MPLAVVMPPPAVPLVGERESPTVVPMTPLLTAPGIAARAVAGGTSEPPPALWAKLAVIMGGAKSKAAAMARL
jgi:hypothetical protein